MAVRNAGTRQDTFILRLTVAGNNYGVWDKKTGGELDSDDLKYNPGGMADTLSLGGRILPGNVVLQRLYDRKDDHDRINTLLNGVGKASVSLAQRPMDQDGNEYGKSIIYTGKLKRVNVPDVDSEANSAAMVEIEISIAGRPQAI
jgi:hypothetical protein